MRASKLPQMPRQAIDNIPSRLPCTTLQPWSCLAGGAQPVASIFHANPTSITSLPAPLCAPRGQVFKENALQVLACSATPAGGLIGKFKIYFLVLGTASRASCLLGRYPAAEMRAQSPEGLSPRRDLRGVNRVRHKRTPDLLKVGCNTCHSFHLFTHSLIHWANTLRELQTPKLHSSPDI